MFAVAVRAPRPRVIASTLIMSCSSFLVVVIGLAYSTLSFRFVKYNFRNFSLFFKVFAFQSKKGLICVSRACMMAHRFAARWYSGALVAAGVRASEVNRQHQPKTIQ